MNSFKQKSVFPVVFITFLTSFLLWILFCLFISQNTTTPLWKTLNEYKQIVQKDGENLDLSRFWQVYEIIEKYSYDIDHIEKQNLIDWAIKWLVEWLGDKHSEYMTLKEKQRFEESLSWDFEWIWAVVEEHPLWVKIDRVIKWSPALKFGILANDILITANETILQDLDLYDAIDLIKGAAGTSVDLEVLREWETEILDITVIRDKIIIPSIESQRLDNNTGYIALNMFGEDTVNEFEKALEELYDTEGLIIDVRDNGGWYLHTATQILSELLPDDTLLVVTKYPGFQPNDVYKAVSFGPVYEKPIVVLINENSASASEILAWALHDHKRWVLVWKNTYGKWSVQQPFQTSNDSLLKITIAKWFTPDGKNIDKQWIAPDIEVSFEKQDYIDKYDRQLEEAKKVLDSFIQNNNFTQTIELFNKEDTLEETTKNEE